MKRILSTGWSFMRVLRIVTGSAGLTYALFTHDYVLDVAGIFLLFTGIFNVAGCGPNGCAIQKQRQSK